MYAFIAMPFTSKKPVHPNTPYTLQYFFKKHTSIPLNVGISNINSYLISGFLKFYFPKDVQKQLILSLLGAFTSVQYAPDLCDP